MAYSYNDFLSAANSSGLMGEFSSYDLETAKRHPDFGMSILSLKKDFHNATTPEQKLLNNEMANELRKSYGNYSGGLNGSLFISEGKIPTEIDRVLDQLGSYGSFSYGDAPSYSNQYAAQQQALLDKLLNRADFTWSKETDPQWGSYKKSYLREGDRAEADTLAKASAASGGRPSSYAVAAASQAGDYYAAKLNDVIPTLYQQAYDKYLNEYSMMQQDLNAVNTQEQLDYQAYLGQLSQYNADREMAYNQWLNGFNQLQSYLGSLQDQDETDYNRYMDKINLGMKKDELDFNRYKNLLDLEMKRDQIAYDRWLGQKDLDQQMFNNGIELSRLYGRIPEQYADILGISAGTPTADQDYNEWRMAQEAAKLAGQQTGGSGSGGNSSKSKSKSKNVKKSGDDVDNNDKKKVDDGSPNTGVSNQTGDGWVRIPGYSRVTWQELESMVDRGEILETYNAKTGKYGYRKNPDYGN